MRFGLHACSISAFVSIAKLRIRAYLPMQLGPELELPGYGCEDHFQELDTVEHCWECISGIPHSSIHGKLDLPL